MNRKTVARASLAVAATAVFAIVFYRNFDVSAIRSLLLRSDLAWLGAGMLASTATTFLRGIRLSLVVRGRASSRLVAASIIHNAVTAVLPMKLGEFALPLLLARTGRLQLSEGVGILLVLRVLDMLGLLLVGATSAALVFASMPGHATWAWLSSTAAAGSLAATLALFASWRSLSARLRREGFLGRIPALQRALQAATMAPPGRLAGAYALSLMVWCSLFLAFFFFSRAVGVDAGPLQAATIGMAASLAFAFPISGVANVGPFQAAWVWMSMALGFEATPALAASIASHGSVVLVTLLLAILASPLLLGTPPARPPGDAPN